MSENRSTTADTSEVAEIAVAIAALRGPLTRQVLARRERRERATTVAERLSLPQHLTLSALLDGPLGMSELAEATGVAISSATRMVQGLQRLGLAQAERRTGEDRRRRFVALTDLGRHTLDEATEIRNGHLVRLLEAVPEERRRAILEGMRALTEALAEDEARQAG